MLTVGALAAFHKRRWAWVAVCLGLASGARVFALLIAPFLLTAAPKRYWALFAATLAGVYLPFLLQGTAGGAAAGLGAFLLNWEFNSTAYALLKAALGENAAKLASASLLLLFIVAYLWFWKGKMASFARGAPPEQRLGTPRGDWIYGMFLLLSPVANPWYLLWLAPFVTLQPTTTGIAALAAVSLSYAHGLHLGVGTLGAYEHPAWVRPVEIGIVLAALLWDGRTQLKRSTCRSKSSIINPQ
jgi:hypothetical protein